MELEGKIALVTGASRGIGQATALALAKEGAIVLGTATTESGAQAITQTLKDNLYQGQGFVLDVTHREACESLIRHIEDQYGPISILVNNAGITRDNLLLRMSEDEWDIVMQTNVTGAYRLSKLCIKSMMKARFGRIINISSVSGTMGNAGQANYAASKAAMIGFSKALAQEIGSRNITVNVVAPGFIETDMTSDLLENIKDTVLEKIPLKRLGKPSEIAEVVVFLASDKASYITGVTLHVNGGMYMV